MTTARVVRELGLGGMAQVLLVEPEPGEPLVVVKRLLPQVAEHPACVDQLIAEGRRMQRLSNTPGVVDVLAVVETPDRAHSHLVLEYVAGNDLGAYLDYLIDGGERCPLGLVLRIGVALCSTLAAVHRALDPNGQYIDLVHRDVCPANLMVGEGDRLVLIDFGVAVGKWPTLPAPSSDQGRVAYMAPEQARGLDVDERADLFSVGVILFELITGSRLYGTTDRIAVLAKIMDGIDYRVRDRFPECPDDVDAVISRALARDREDRHFDAADLCRDLERLAERHGTEPLAGARLDRPE